MLKWLLVLCLAFTATLGAEIKVLAFSGSMRKESANKKLVIEAANMATKLGATVTVINLEDYSMPFYDADLEAEKGLPANAKRLRQLMMDSQVIFIASPEYNSSLSAILKNTLDWATRDEHGAPSREAFSGKTFAIMSASPGPGGGSRGLVHLKSVIENAGGKIIPQTLSIPNSYDAFDAEGHLKDSKLKNELENLVQQAISSR